MSSHTKSQFGPFVVDVKERVLERDDQPVSLTPKAFDLLAVFIEHPGRLISKDELLHKLWPDTFVDESNLAYNVFALRKALGDTAGNANYIETVPKRGYRFKADVTPVSNSDAAGLSSNGRLEPVSVPPVPPAIEPFTAERKPTGDPSSRRSKRWMWIAVPIVLVTSLGLAALSWRAPFDREAPRAVPLTSLQGILRSPSLSPDGNYVVFSWTRTGSDNSDLYLQQVGTGGPLQLTGHPANDYAASWSPDGLTIAFLRRAAGSGNSEVWLTAPLGGDSAHKLADIHPRLPMYRPPSLAWCPNSRCVLVTDSPGIKRPDAVFSIAVDGGEKRQLTFPEGMGSDSVPTISPDGRFLVFRRDTTPFSGSLHRLAIKGDGTPDGEPIRLTPTLNIGRPIWLPGSREIIFPARGGLWRLDVLRGGAPARLPFVGQDGSHPVVSQMPDGRLRLVYVRGFWDGNVWRIDTSAPGAPALSPAASAIASTRNDFLPNLSPDGRRVAFLSDRSGELHVWLADPNGASAQQLTTLSFSSSPGFPRWSPNGDRLAFHGDPEGRPDVLVVPSRGGEPRILTRDMINGGFPSFSRDGQWIYFTVNEMGESRIWRMPATGGAAVPITPNAGILAIESTDRRDLFYVDSVERPGSLWRLPLAGGLPPEPEKVLDGIVGGSFDVIEGGIYYIHRSSGDAGRFATDSAGSAASLQYFDFSTRRSTTVVADLGVVLSGLSASQDGRHVFFSREDSSINELMRVDNFR